MITEKKIFNPIKEKKHFDKYSYPFPPVTVKPFESEELKKLKRDLEDKENGTRL